MNRVRASIVAVLVGALLIGWPGARAFADITNSTGTNVQNGDNRGTSGQHGSSGSSDAVGGQVTGVVAGGRTSVDATNVSNDSSVQSGDAHGTNTSSSFVGLNKTGVDTNAARATTGDGVGGEVIGAVTAADGSASIVAANTSKSVDATTGDADASNGSNAFGGLANANAAVLVGDVSQISTDGPSNVQDGNNTQTLAQSAGRVIR